MQARINQKACLDLCITFSLALLDARARVVFMRSQNKMLAIIKQTVEPSSLYTTSKYRI